MLPAFDEHSQWNTWIYARLRCCEIILKRKLAGITRYRLINRTHARVLFLHILRRGKLLHEVGEIDDIFYFNSIFLNLISVILFYCAVAKDFVIMLFAYPAPNRVVLS